jgi:hypothetical protein
MEEIEHEEINDEDERISYCLLFNAEIRDILMI